MSTVANRVAALVDRKPDGPDVAALTAALIDEHMATGQPVEEVLTRWEQTTELSAAVLLPAIRRTLGLRANITRIVKTLSTPEHFRIETDAGIVVLGPPSRWATRPQDFKAAFLGICEMPMLPKAGPARDDLCRMIATAAEPEDVGEEATDAGWMRAMLRDYLAARPPAADVDAADLTSEYPFRDNERVCLIGPTFRRWLLLTHQERVSPTDYGRRLRAAGCEPGKVNVGTGAARTSRQVWRLPAELQ